MARHTVGPRRTDSPHMYVRATRIIGALSVLVLAGAIAWDLADDGFWSRHALFTSLLASFIVVATTAAVLNELLERRQRERWSVLAQYALFDLLRAARLVWSGLLELAGLAPDGELGDGALEAGSEAVHDTQAGVKQGEPLSRRLEDHDVFPPMVVQMMAVGEETGALDEMLDKIADFYDQEVEATVDALTSLIEPLLIVVMGVCVGGMIISLYLPMFNIIKLIK